MNCTIRRFVIAMACALLAVSVVVPGNARVEARGATFPTYCSDGDQTFWFIHMSDPHIGTSGSTDSDNLTWIVTKGRQFIQPLFTVVTGDLTDSTNGNIFGYPNGPYLTEWTQYRSILNTAGISALSDVYYDIPGNHDGYNDATFAYFRNHGIQGGRYTPGGQVSWTKALSFGTYHFVAVNTADNTGAAFSILSPYGDHAGLDSNELTALTTDLNANAAASLSFAFGHHPVTATSNSSDTYLYYGASQFVSTLSAKGVLAYNYGHAHDNVETVFAGNSYTGAISPGIRYSRVASLGKDSPNSYSVVSVDCNGVNSVTQPVGAWPVVLVTAPVNRYVGTAVNPFAYDVTAGQHPVRALIFADGAVSGVEFRVNGGTWYPMWLAAGSQWSGTWDSSGLASGEYTIEVRATRGTTTRSHVIKVNVVATSVNRPPVGVNDAYSTTQGKALTVAAPGVLTNDSDPDGNPITAVLVTAPASGATVSLADDGSFTYAPVSNFVGTDTFTYQARDSAAALSAVAVVSIGVTAAPATDTVTITTATYTKRTKTLLVKATSSAAPGAVLTVNGGATMAYNAKTKTYTYQAVVPTPPTQVTVSSSAGGTATKTVSIK